LSVISKHDQTLIYIIQVDILQTRTRTAALFITELLSEALFIAALFIIIQCMNMNIFVDTSAQEATFKVNKITLRKRKKKKKRRRKKEKNSFFNYYFFHLKRKEKRMISDVTSEEEEEDRAPTPNNSINKNMNIKVYKNMAQ